MFYVVGKLMYGFFQKYKNYMGVKSLFVRSSFGDIKLYDVVEDRQGILVFKKR